MSHYTAKLLFHQSPTWLQWLHCDWTATVWSPLLTAGSMVTTQLINCVVIRLLTVVNCDYTVNVQSPCSHCRWLMMETDGIRVLLWIVKTVGSLRITNINGHINTNVILFKISAAWLWLLQAPWLNRKFMLRYVSVYVRNLQTPYYLSGHNTDLQNHASIWTNDPSLCNVFLAWK